MAICKKTHDLPELHDELADRGIDGESFRESAEMLARQYLAGRYPGTPDVDLSDDETRKILRATTQTVEFLMNRADAKKGGIAEKPEQLKLPLCTENEETQPREEGRS